MLLLIVCPLSLVILFTVNGSEAISKGSAKIHSFTKFFIHVFSIRVRITLVEHFSLFIEKDYLIMLLVWRQVMQNLCSHCR